MMKFFEIPKNAHDTAFFLVDFYQLPQDVDVLILRDPLKRFWSACKTNTPELSPFGNFPTYTQEEFKNAPTTYEGLDLTPQQVINNIKDKLNQNDLSVHLQTQVSFIGNKKFDHIIKVETFKDDLDKLSEFYGLPIITDEQLPHTHASVKEWDEEAMSIINSDNVIKEFYQEDIAIYENPQSLFKTKYNNPELDDAI